QYRELAAFAAFGSDLDEGTQAKLTRGERLVEILKQPQFQPLPMEKQVTIIYAGANGYLDPLPVDTLGDYENELYSYIESNEPTIFTDIVAEEQFTDAIKDKLNKVLTSFGDTFKAGKGLN
ncbi:MAG: F0F1 ATP synthase subunit alpha, partial [Deltaproteobacteria bacterium]|nr:F0F1 ATP synthase subunit alpha [Deltaproteobacteria bacterium]